MTWMSLHLQNQDRAKIQIIGVSKTSDHILINIQIQNPSQEPQASSKAPKQDLKDMNVLCTFKIKIDSQNTDHVCIKNQWPYQYQDQDPKPQSETSSILQSNRSGLKGHGCSLHRQIQDREPKFGAWVSHRSLTISKSISRCHFPVRSLQHPRKP